MTITQSELDELKALMAKATKGPWKALGSEAKPCPIIMATGTDGYQIHDMQRISRDDPNVWRHMKLIYQRDAELIAASHNIMPRLIAELEAARTALGEKHETNN